jgi:hypothetical protein
LRKVKFVDEVPHHGWPTFARLAELGIEWAANPRDTW